ncbi:MAG TPA: prolipoprotein diacylglyceryl transferase [Chloroflexota bacterium]|jgi:phosphatidylglycerol:prolipoprotein diacylglycerol transferase|nr:prolipoprotein diacylglyceryl transferase [Chloroflexota bacterium]
MLPLIEISVDPIIVHLGPLALRWYSLMITVGVLVGTWMAARFARQRGIPEDDVYSGALWVVLGGIIGARLAHVVDRFDYYRLNPDKILAVYEGGLAIWGAVIVGGLAGWAFTRRNRIKFWPFADAVAHGAILGQAIGRIGCIINGDVAGRPTGGDWGFVYTNPHALLPRPEYFNVPTHPYPLYEMVWDLALFGLLFVVARRAKFDGAVFLVYAIVYSLGRFVLTFVREEETWLFGLQQAQVISLIVIVVAAYLYLYLRGRRGRLRPPGTRPRPAPVEA